MIFRRNAGCPLPLLPVAVFFGRRNASGWAEADVVEDCEYACVLDEGAGAGDAAA